MNLTLLKVEDLIPSQLITILISFLEYAIAIDPHMSENTQRQS